MDTKENLLPFRDSQDVKIAERCSRCGREIYAPGGCCHYCGRFWL